MQAYVKRIKGLSLVGKADSNHWVPMDAATKLGGLDAGARPMELVLIGLGGCTSMDVISILEKKRVPLEDFEIELEAEQAEDYPRVFTSIKMKYIFYGKNIKPADVERAIELSQTKYCSVSAMLKKVADIKVEYEIRESKCG
ncbi:MAG: OsmC family protein [candidate division KSB1 bacterium]|nr:OsmC family protein [candidate division KSB1 bacterium]